MATKQTKLLDVVRQFKDEAQKLVKKTQADVQELVVNTANDIGKLAANNPQIKKVVSRVEAEQKKYEKIFMDLQDKALDLYKDRAKKTISDIKNKIEGYRKQADKLYKEAILKKKATVKSKTSSKAKSRPKAKKVNVVKSGSTVSSEM